MPIPFLAGFALGCAAVYAYNNRDKIKEGANKIVSSKSVEELKNSVKGGAEKLSKKSKEIFAEAKEGLDDVAEAVKSKRKSGGKKAATSSDSTAKKTRKKPGPKPGFKRTKKSTASAKTGATPVGETSAASTTPLNIPQIVKMDDNSSAKFTSADDKSEK
ncbi:hypothetical protein [uncultured Campylobacter sp.]|uniref:hypothetical protein n=1 Tax=uncultured Campylobacter sp. TaxID=218934 RepID=UPI0026317D02|nr:hypothetical protein [uncultured Campylobacter sp.]